MQLSRPSRPKFLSRIIRIPNIQIPDLRALGRGNSNDFSRRNFPRPPGPDRESEGLAEAAWRGGDGAVEGAVGVEDGAREGEVGWGWGVGLGLERHVFSFHFLAFFFSASAEMKGLMMYRI